MNFISLNSNWKFELNKSIGKKKRYCSSGKKPAGPNRKHGLLPSPLSPSMAYRPIPATTDNEVGQGVVGEEAWTEGDRWDVVGWT
jgi:hypothetical protein